MRSTFALSALLALSLGCPGRTPGSTTPEPTPDATPPQAATLGADVFVQAKAVAATEDEAYAAACASLTQSLLGDATWGQRVALPVHRRDVDPMVVTRGPEGHEVQVGLSRMGAAAVLSAFEEAEPKISGPEAWRGTLQDALRIYQSAQACARRRELFGATCEPPDTTQIDAALQQLGKGLTLDPAHRDGVPVLADGTPLRDPAVFVLWGGVLLPGMPLLAEPAAGVELVDRHASSDLVGRASFEPTTALGPIRVHLDGDALLGPLADRVPAIEVTLEPRTVGWKRWALVVSRGSRGHQPNDEVMSDVLDGMKAVGAGNPVEVDRKRAEALLAAKGDARRPLAAAVGDALGGRVDVVLVLSYDSRFASRMGGNRVWYEAEGELEVRSAWTGEVLASAHTKVEVDGLGEDRADRAARRRLTRVLVQQAQDARAPH